MLTTQRLTGAMSHQGLPIPAEVVLRARASRLQGRAREALVMLTGLESHAGTDHVLPRELAEAALSCGDTTVAEDAARMMIAQAAEDPVLLAAGLALSEQRLAEAEAPLRARLREYPADVVAIRMMAELATRLGRMEAAERLLRRALHLAPFYTAARELLARNLQRLNRAEEALAEVVQLVEAEPEHPSYGLLHGSLLVKVGDQAGARAVYERVLAAYPRQAKGWMSLGHVLKTLGYQADGIAAYRRAIQEQPTLGEAWWSLANLKTVAFSDEDLSAMRAALEGQRPDELDDDDHLHLHFALGKALEDRRDYPAAFEHWRTGNAIRRRALPYSADETHADCVAAARFFGRERLLSGSGASAPDPIFILGLPRSGSTLVEQILASHSQVEGTTELPDMMAIAARLRGAADAATYYAKLAELTLGQLRELGEEYLERTRIHRREGRPFFIDKMPNNWLHAGLIRVILPNARIIDARRNPGDGCLSAWKQHFARGQAFSYDLTDLGRYYRDYVALMDHFDRTLPGMVYRVQYERMVTDTEAEVSRLLDHCGLPFEPGCLAFYENKRAVRTPSSEQVRQPIFTEGLGHWRNFATELQPIFAALGPDLAPV